MFTEMVSGDGLLLSFFLRSKDSFKIFKKPFLPIWKTDFFREISRFTTNQS